MSSIKDNLKINEGRYNGSLRRNGLMVVEPKEEYDLFVELVTLLKSDGLINKDSEMVRVFKERMKEYHPCIDVSLITDEIGSARQPEDWGPYIKDTIALLLHEFIRHHGEDNFGRQVDTTIHYGDGYAQFKYDYPTIPELEDHIVFTHMMCNMALLEDRDLVEYLAS